MDILNPVQSSATGMDPERLKREFGGKIAFGGGSCDAQGTLAHGTPDEVARETEPQPFPSRARQRSRLCAHS